MLPALPDDELRAWLALARCPTLTADALRPALARAGSAAAAVEAPHAWFTPAVAA